MTKKQLPDVCHEPEPVTRAWAILRKELGFLLLHDQRQRVYDVIAHEVAQEQRRHFGVGDTPVRAHCDPDCDFCQGVTSAADFADPEVKP